MNQSIGGRDIAGPRKYPLFLPGHDRACAGTVHVVPPVFVWMRCHHEAPTSSVGRWHREEGIISDYHNPFCPVGPEMSGSATLKMSETGPHRLRFADPFNEWPLTDVAVSLPGRRWGHNNDGVECF